MREYPSSQDSRTNPITPKELERKNVWANLTEFTVDDESELIPRCTQSPLRNYGPKNNSKELSPHCGEILLKSFNGFPQQGESEAKEQAFMAQRQRNIFSKRAPDSPS